jgi:hypothetical protein
MTQVLSPQHRGIRLEQCNDMLGTQTIQHREIRPSQEGDIQREMNRPKHFLLPHGNAYMLHASQGKRAATGDTAGIIKAVESGTSCGNHASVPLILCNKG